MFIWKFDAIVPAILHIEKLDSKEIKPVYKKDTSNLTLPWCYVRYLILKFQNTFNDVNGWYLLYFYCHCFQNT